MSNSLKIIERVRASTETGTDYAVAKALGMDQGNLLQVKKGKRGLGPTAIFAAAKILKVDAQDLFYLVREDRAKSEAEKLHWRSLCSEGIRTLFDIAGKSAASFLITAPLTLLLLSSGVPRHVEGATGLTPPPLCAFWWGRIRRWLATARSRATVPNHAILATA